MAVDSEMIMMVGVAVGIPTVWKARAAADMVMVRKATLGKVDVVVSMEMVEIVRVGMDL